MSVVYSTDVDEEGISASEKRHRENLKEIDQAKEWGPIPTKVYTTVVTLPVGLIGSHAVLGINSIHAVNHALTSQFGLSTGKAIENTAQGSGFGLVKSWGTYSPKVKKEKKTEDINAYDQVMAAAQNVAGRWHKIQDRLTLSDEDFERQGRTLFVGQKIRLTIFSAARGVLAFAGLLILLHPAIHKMFGGGTLPASAYPELLPRNTVSSLHQNPSQVADLIHAHLCHVKVGCHVSKDFLTKAWSHILAEDKKASSLPDKIIGYGMVFGLAAPFRKLARSRRRDIAGKYVTGAKRFGIFPRKRLHKVVFGKWFSPLRLKAVKEERQFERDIDAYNTEFNTNYPVVRSSRQLRHARAQGYWLPNQPSPHAVMHARRVDEARATAVQAHEAAEAAKAQAQQAKTHARTLRTPGARTVAGQAKDHAKDLKKQAKKAQKAIGKCL